MRSTSHSQSYRWVAVIKHTIPILCTKSACWNKVNCIRVGREKKVVKLNLKPCEILLVPVKHTVIANIPIGRIATSLVPRYHPLMRRNGLMNQVEFLGLAHAFATNNLATFKPFAFNPLKKRCRYSNRDEQTLLLWGKCCVIFTNLAISLVLTTLGNKPKELDFVHQTISHRETRMRWARDYIATRLSK